MKSPIEDGVAESGLEKSFSRHEEEFWALRGKLSAGRMTQEDFNEAVTRLEVRDPQGEVWRMHPEDGVWLSFKNDQWVRANPYAAEADVAPLEPKGVMEPACQQCGAILRKGKRYCFNCGAEALPELPSLSAQPRASSQEPAPPTFDSMPPPPPTSGGMRFGFEGVKPEPVVKQPEAQKIERQAQKTEHAEPDLPPPVQTWGFQDKLSEVIAKTLEASEQSGVSARTGLGAMLPRMIRASLLDKTIYREVAADTSLQSEAWQVMILVIVLSSSGVLIASIQNLSASLLYSMVPTAVIQVVAVLARIWVTQMVASSWLKTPTSFNQFFRALVYAQSPVSLQIIPVAGQFIGLWSLITSTAAVRDITGCSTKNAAILAIVSILGGMVAVSFAAPFVQTLLARF